MGKRIAAILLLIGCLPVFGASTLLHRELFLSASNNVVPLTSVNTDQFGVVSGTMHVVGVGAKATNQTDLGWSCLLTNQSAWGLWSCTQTGMLSGWYFLSNYGDGTHNSSFIAIYGGGGFTWANASFTPDGFIAINDVTNNMAQVPLHKWEFLTLAWRQNGSGSDFRAYLGTNSTLVCSNLLVVGWPTIVSNAVGSGVWGDTGWQGRVTGLSTYRMDDFSDVGVPGDLTPPPSTRNTWYVNPTTGSDIYDGLSASTPFKTAGRLVQFLGQGGIFPNIDAPWVYTGTGLPIATNIASLDWVSGVTNGTIRANGDKVLIDTSAGELAWDYALPLISPDNDGIEICSATATQAKLSLFKAISTFIQYDSVNYPNVWTCSDSDVKAVLWEDRKWLDSPLGASISAVRSSLNSNAGSFWTDGSTMYFSPLEVGSNPNTSGHVFERSYLRHNGANPADYAEGIVLTGGATVHLHHLSIGGNTFRDSSSGTVNAMYSLHATGGIKSAVGDSRIFYGGSHCYGGTGGPTNLLRLVYRTVMDQGPPWTTNATGFSPAVEYTSETAGSREVYYVDCNWATNSVIGSSVGVEMDATHAMGICNSHYDGGSPFPYALWWVESCRGGFNPGIATNTIVTNCYLGVLEVFSPVEAYSSTIVDQLNGGGPTTISGSILAPRIDANLAVHGLMSGSWNLSGCTIDLRVTTNFSYLQMSGLNSWTLAMTNNAILAGIRLATFEGSGTVLSDRNEWVIQSPYLYADTGSNYRTWADWLASGYDAHSVTNVSACLDSRYRPYAKTPCWTVGTELGPATDFTGKLFQSRRTAGAYEYVTPQPTLLMFGQ